MLSRSPLFVAAVLTVTAAAAWAQTPRNESAEQNVKESQAYERLVCSNPSFRAKRIAQECGPINDPQLHQSCLASFECGKGGQAPHFRQAPPSTTIR
jgi:hypothetical protein